MKCSVIICTYNPNFESLNKVLDALKNQSVSFNEWELIVVDNASNQNLADILDISWHSNSKIVRENNKGRINALIRGYTESRTNLLITVDDDNELSDNYIEKTIDISENWPMLGVWGASIKGIFKKEVPKFFISNLDVIGVTEIQKDYYGNCYLYKESLPIGAGMCIRRPVFEYYINLLNKQPIHKILTRTGSNYLSAEDRDLVYCSLDLGFGTARFASLKINHLIHESRLSKENFIKTYLGNNTANIVLKELRPQTKDPVFAKKRTIIRKLKFIIKYIKSSKVCREIIILNEKSRIQAKKILHEYHSHH